MNYDNSELSWPLIGHVGWSYICFGFKFIGAVLYGMCLGTAVVNVVARPLAKWDLISKCFIAWKGRNFIKAAMQHKGGHRAKHNL